MKLTHLLLVVLMVLLLVPVVSADHTILFQNHCSYDVWVDIQGGLQYTSGADTFGACSCLKNLTCSPTTKCNNTGCGPSLNKCDQGSPLVDGGGFKLNANSGTHTTTVSDNWQGTFWGRTGCTGADDNLICEVGTCPSNFDGKGKLQCGGIGPTPSTLTKGELNFDQGGHDTYDVSLVDGFNVPIKIELVPGTGQTGSLPGNLSQYDCTVSGGVKDLLPEFPTSGLTSDLAVRVNNNNLSVMSACTWAMSQSPYDIRWKEYCCKDPWGSRQDYTKNGNTMCDPSTWPSDLQTARFFKTNMPEAYSYAYDDSVSTFQCMSTATTKTAYIVTFCGADEGYRTYADGSSEHTHAADSGSAVTATPAPVPAQTPVPSQTAVSQNPFNPVSTGGSSF